MVLDKLVSIEYLIVDLEGFRFEFCFGLLLFFRFYYIINKFLFYLCVCVVCYIYDIVFSLVYIIFVYVYKYMDKYICINVW